MGPDVQTTEACSIERYALYSLPASLLLHAALAAFLTRPATVPEPEVMFVSLVTEKTPFLPAMRPSETQLVSPPEAGRGQKPQETRFRSDADSYAEREQVRRGDGADAGPQLGKGGSAPGSSKQQTKKVAQPTAASKHTVAGKSGAAKRAPRRAARKGGLDLSTDHAALRKITGTADNRAVKHDQGGSLGSVAPAPAPFSRSAGSGAKFLGFSGTSDFLPDLPDGDITLLNAKASKFAVFVRRVAIAVFGQLKLQGWTGLRASDVQAIRDSTVVVASLSPQGRLLNVELHNSSSSRRFDDLVQSAVRAGANDPHPPPEAAAADGNFRFVFMARSWVQIAGDARRGGMSQRRWLLLQTGLE